jgi:hypothetical protein
VFGEPFPRHARNRYVWEGTPAPGQKLVFTQLYYPHPPYRARATPNNPNPGAKAAYANELQATAHVLGIQVIRDDVKASVLRLELESSRTEWVVFNPQTETIQAASIKTSAIDSGEP